MAYEEVNWNFGFQNLSFPHRKIGIRKAATLFSSTVTLSECWQTLQNQSHQGLNVKYFAQDT